MGLISRHPYHRTYYKTVRALRNTVNAGEFIDSILHTRSQSSAMPIIMSDALASNRPTVTTTMTSLCNSHARRQFVDVISHFPEEVAHILMRYGEIWTHDHQIAEQQLSLAKRLEYHRTHSFPVMADRKNAMFHKTLLGATIGDVITSMIATGSEAGVNVMDYFTVLQREQE